MKVVSASQGVHRIEAILVDPDSRVSEVLELDRVYDVAIEGGAVIIRQGIRGDAENPWRISMLPLPRIAGMEITEQAK